jgi:hypothetical protein
MGTVRVVRPPHRRDERSPNRTNELRQIAVEANTVLENMLASARVPSILARTSGDRTSGNAARTSSLRKPAASSVPFFVTAARNTIPPSSASPNFRT